MGGYLERLKSQKVPTHGTAKTAKRAFYSKCSCRGRHISEKTQQIPAPEPAGLGPRYEALWNQAWTLADYIDNPHGSSLAERKARLPELNRLRAEMAEIERQAMPPAAPDPETSPPGTWHTWTPADTRQAVKDRTAENWPARCKRSGKCYARAYYQGKPGRAKDCEPDGCKHIKGKEVGGVPYV
jgi:hypothetical protein